MKEYTAKVLERFTSPKHIGEIEDADGVGTAGNPVCGDVMRLYIKVEDGIIKDAKFKTFGCVAAIATSDAVIDLVIGKSIEEALKITNKDVVELLGGELPPQKYHCSLLAEEALKKAIEDYMKRNGHDN